MTKADMARVLLMLQQDFCNGWAVNLGILVDEYNQWMPEKTLYALEKTDDDRHNAALNSVGLGEKR